MICARSSPSACGETIEPQSNTIAMYTAGAIHPATSWTLSAPGWSSASLCSIQVTVHSTSLSTHCRSSSRVSVRATWLPTSRITIDLAASESPPPLSTHRPGKFSGLGSSACSLAATSRRAVAAASRWRNPRCWRHHASTSMREVWVAGAPRPNFRPAITP